MGKNDGTLRLYCDEETGAAVPVVSAPAEPVVEADASVVEADTGTPPEVSDPPAASDPPADTGEDIVVETNLWEALSQEIESDDSDEGQVLEEPVTPPVSPAPAEPTPPTEPPAVEVPPVTPEATVTPPVADLVAPAPVVQPEEVPVVTPSATPAEIEAATKAQQETFMANLVAHYKITDEEATQMVTAPEVIMPKLLARVFADVHKSVLGSVREHLPEAIRHNSQVSTAQQAKAQTFFDAWPKLNKAVHGIDIATATRVYASLNPDATDEDLIRDVGMQVMMKHKIAPDAIAPAPLVEETPPAPPRTPAAVHSSAAVLPGNDIWGEMSQEILDDEES